MKLYGAWCAHFNTLMPPRARDKPKRLAEKLFAIRKASKLSQSQLAKRIGVPITPARVSEYEHGVREPDLLVLLGYARVAKVHLEQIVDDDSTFQIVLMPPMRVKKGEVKVLDLIAFCELSVRRLQAERQISHTRQISVRPYLDRP